MNNLCRLTLLMLVVVAMPVGAGLPPDVYENDDSMDDAGLIIVGQCGACSFPQDHTFHTPDDVDWLQFQIQEIVVPGTQNPVNEPHAIRIMPTAGDVALLLELFNEQGQPETLFAEGGSRLACFDSTTEVTIPFAVTPGLKFLRITQPAEAGEIDCDAPDYNVRVYVPSGPEQGWIEGFITDSCTGDPIGFAEIDTDPPRGSGSSDRNGLYGVMGLQPDTYSVIAEADGFQRLEIPGVKVTESGPAALNIQLLPAGKGACDYAVTGSQSGSWFDSSHNGEGWLLEVLFEETKLANGTKAPGLAVAYWFTYPPPDAKGAAGEQAWIVGVGSVTGDTITFNDALITTGGVFGPAFDPDTVVFSTWGDFTFTFSGPDAGSADYDGIWGAGQLDMSRITSLAGLTAGKVTSIGPEISGSWFDPGHNGEGWLIEVLTPGVALIYWFSYDSDGNQAWFVGVGNIDGKTITVPDVLIPRGAVFGPTFDPDDVSLDAWGTMTFTFDSCSSGTMSYASSKGSFGSGSLNLERITSVAGLPCE